MITMLLIDLIIVSAAIALFDSRFKTDLPPLYITKYTGNLNNAILSKLHLSLSKTKSSRNTFINNDHPHNGI